MTYDTPTEPIPVLPIRPKRTGRNVADVALTIGAILGLMCIMATVTAAVFGVRPLIFETGSMAPSIAVGSLGVSRTVPAADVHVGDIVSVVRDDGTRVTHRVASVGAASSTSATLTLRGDANPVSDPHPYIVAEAQRVYFTVPALGYVATWLGNPFTIALQVLAVVALLLIAFAPRQGWRRTPTARRILGTTAIAVSVAVGSTGMVDPGDAHAANSFAAAQGTLTTGRPANPTSLTCYNTTTTYLLLPYATVELWWPNPPSQSNYTYELSFPGQTGPAAAPINIPAAGQPSTIKYKFEQSILQNLLTWILGGGQYTVMLTNKVGNFRSAGTVTQSVRATTPIIDIPAGIKCATPAGTLSRTAPTASPSSPSAPSAPASSSEVPGSSTESSAKSSLSSEAPTTSSSAQPSPTSATPTLPPDGTATSSKAFAFYQDGTKITIRDTKTTDVVYRGSFASTATARWLPGTEKLEITEPDGSVTVVTQQGDRWVEDVTPPAPTTTQTTERIAPTTETEPRPSVTPTESVVSTE